MLLLDENITPLVEDFNDIPRIITYFSCQGDVEDADGDKKRGYIAFEYIDKDCMVFYKNFAMVDIYETGHEITLEFLDLKTS